MIKPKQKSFSHHLRIQAAHAKRTVTVEVTAEDIEQGAACDCWNCPVQKAVRRATGAHCSVHAKDMHLFNGNNFKARLPLPPEVVAWVASFDSGDKVEPFSFSLTF